MGKSLIIKGADFSANGVPVTVIAGTLSKVNNNDTALNVTFDKTGINSLGLNAGSATLYMYSNDASVNTALKNQHINVMQNQGGTYVTVGNFAWGDTFTFTAPLEYNLIFQKTQVSGLENKTIYVDFYMN